MKPISFCFDSVRVELYDKSVQEPDKPPGDIYRLRHFLMDQFSVKYDLIMYIDRYFSVICICNVNKQRMLEELRMKKYGQHMA